MWNACAKMNRLENAIRLRGIDPENMSLSQLNRVLMKRGTDAQLNPVVGTLIDILEPPRCEMTHCKFHGGASAPMNCADRRLPSRCKILKDYRARKKARTAKDWRNVLNDDAGSIKYDDMPKNEALEKAEQAAEALKRRCHTADAKKRYDIALEGAKAELSVERGSNEQ